MRTSTLILLGGLAAAAAAAWWYWSESQQSEPSSSELDTSDWGLGTATDAVTSALQDATGSIADVIENVTSGPRGIRNNNPLNLRYIATDPWNGQTGNDGGYGIYSSPALGVRAGSKQLQKDFAGGDTTLSDLIYSWAPPSENDTASYLADVAERTGLDPDAPLDLEGNLPQIVNAMIYHENGQNPYLYSDIQQWVYLS